VSELVQNMLTRADLMMIQRCLVGGTKDSETRGSAISRKSAAG